MTWNWDLAITIIYSGWTTSSPLELLLSCLLFAILSANNEALRTLQSIWDAEARHIMHHQLTSAYAIAYHVPYADPDVLLSIHFGAPGRWRRMTVFGARKCLQLTLMLVVMMTFNGQMIFSIIAGSMLGYWIIEKSAAFN